MSTIKTSLRETEVNEHIYPHISVAKRGYACKIPLFKVFNYTLYKLHTGCQWSQLAIARDSAGKKEMAQYGFQAHEQQRS